MNTILPPPLYHTPNAWDEATPCSAPVFSCDLPGVNKRQIFTQDFQQWSENWQPLAMSTAHDDYEDFLLVNESERTDIGGGLVRWTRTYAAIPETHSERSTYNYNFIGYYGTFGFNVANPTGRSRQQKTVAALIVYEYFLLEDLPEPIAATQYLVIANGAPPEEGLPTDYLIDAVAGVNIATTPSRSEYQAMISTDSFNIVARESTIARWMGDIYRRETIYVKAQ